MQEDFKNVRYIDSARAKDDPSILSEKKLQGFFDAPFSAATNPIKSTFLKFSKMKKFDIKDL